MPAGPRWNLLPGYPDAGLIAIEHWRAAWRAAAQDPVPSGLPFDQPHRPLQRALATHLRRTRGVAADPADIILVPGVSAGLRALVLAAALAGRPVAFEQPGYSEGRRALQAAGAVIRPVPVDEEGLDPADLDAGDAAAYTTPAHQFPLGARLSAARRAALIGWARRARALVIEDDYDGEFRYDVRGLPALHSMTGGPDVVAYLGTASKILSPGLRVAWMIAPPDLRQPVRDALARTDERISAPAGDALAHFIASGHLASHLARAARTYAARRAGAASRDCAGWGCGSPAWTRGCTWSPTCRRGPTRPRCSGAWRRRAWPWTCWASSARRRWTGGRWSAVTRCCRRPRPRTRPA